MAARFRPPFDGHVPHLTNRQLILLVQLERHGNLTLGFGPYNGRDVDPDGVEHGRHTCRSWSLRGLIQRKDVAPPPDANQQLSYWCVWLTSDGYAMLAYYRRVLGI